MLKKPIFSFLAILALAALFVSGAIRLFSLQYAKGDEYPAFSSLRTDPQGIKALADSLASLPNISVKRNFRPLIRLQPTSPITLVYAGLDPLTTWDGDELREFNRLLSLGSRAVFTFAPEDSSETAPEKVAPTKTPPIPPAPPTDSPPNSPLSFDSVAKTWGFQFATFPHSKKSPSLLAKPPDSASPLEPQIPWHSLLYFKNLSPEWTVLYRANRQPVVIERSLNSGSVILASDSFFLSNQALREGHHSQLLARIFNGPPKIIFDEDHLGITDQPGVASLIRNYGLTTTIGALLVLTLLFVWKQSTHFIPPRHDLSQLNHRVDGKDTTAGFAQLLRRTIKPNDLLPVAFAEWRKSGIHRPAELAQAEEILQSDQSQSPRQRQPVSTYQSIAHSLSRKP